MTAATHAERRNADARARAHHAAWSPVSVAVGEACPSCPYSIRIHVDAGGGWLGCPPDDATAAIRWGRP